MPEFSDHTSWLSEIDDRLKEKRTLTEAERLKMIATCERVLSQNKESTMAQGILTRIQDISRTMQDAMSMTAESPKEKVGRKIEETESGMGAMESLITSKLHLVRCDNLRKALMNPFHLINANKTNPFKNFENLREQAERENRPSQMLALAMPNNRHFVYNVVNKRDLDSQGAMIGTNAIGRMVAMHEGYDLTKRSRQFTVYHEMVHLMHHAMQRKKNMQAFVTFYMNLNPRVIANEEFDAYGIQIEGMNLVLDDFFRKSAAQGNAVDPSVVRREFQFEDSETVPATFLSLMAREYFRGDGDVVSGRFPERFKELIRLTIRVDGAEVFEYGQPRVPTP